MDDDYTIYNKLLLKKQTITEAPFNPFLGKFKLGSVVTEKIKQ